MKKLYLHIGHGKTGSTSIQNYLDSNKDVINNQGYFYCGINLNSLGKDRSWKDTPWGFNSIPKEEFANVYFDELQKYFSIADNLGCSNLIMSNEGYADQMDKLTQFIELAANHGIEVNVIYYIRHPYDWMISAYQQWGVKHKSYKGEIKPFSEFRHQDKESPFEETLTKLAPLKNTKNVNIHIKKIEESIEKDVVKDFLNYIGLSTVNYIKTSTNEKLSLSEEAFYYIYNNKQKDITLPHKAHSIKMSLNDNHNEYNKYCQNFDIKLASSSLKSCLNKTNKLIENPYCDKEITSKPTTDYLTFNIIKNHLDLLDKIDVDRLRDLAMKLEDTDLEVSLELMELASLFRPKGPLITKKISEYKKTIKEQRP